MPPLRFAFLLSACGLLIACGDDSPMPDSDAGCATAADCDDGVFCNGEELCNMGSCMEGTPPCADGMCMEAMDMCTDACDDPDADGDGVDRIECGGNDCDDEDANRYPGNTEICDEEGIDEDCDPTTVGDRDVDGDGHIDAACCNGDTCGDDCADRLPDFFGGATETCDLRDQDCDGNVDEGVTVMLYEDLDGDLYGDDTEILACAGSARTSTSNIDCEAAEPRTHGAQVEVCDGIDNDCDDNVDEDTVTFPWYPDTDGDGFGDPSETPIVACAPPDGHSQLPLDCDDDDGTLYPAADELCNARDDNCDGIAGFIIAPGDTEDDDRDGYPDEGCGGNDCDDRDPFNYPGGLELCDGLDNDCDGTIDEDVVDVDWYLDADGDGFGDSSDVVSSCERQVGRVLVGGDCMDGNPVIYPGRLEVCNAVDDDCDGTTDEGGLGAVLAFRDSDGDGYGDPTMRMPFCSGSIGSGYVAFAGDCDDSDMEVRPGVADDCDGVDDDCDGLFDEDGVIDWYVDFDGDDYGIGGVVLTQCAEPANAADNADDCNDEDPAIFPMATEVCDDVDQDCDTNVDEGVPDEIFYMDLDGDGSAATDATPVLACRATGNLVPTRTDCDDTNELIFTGASEVCDGIDNNCDTVIDTDALDNFCGGTDATGICDPAGTPGQCACMTAGRADCDANQGNGCETVLASSNLHCGGCGNACSDIQYCDSGSCATAALIGLEGGGTTMCGVREGGRHQCWGQPQGLFSGGDANTAQIATLLDAYTVIDFDMSLDGNYWHKCAIVDDGTGDRDIYCFGRNGYGQLGRGFTSPTFDFIGIGRIDPAIDETINDWEELALGWGYTLARRANGEIWGWGLQDRGQLTQATNQSYPNPVQVATSITDATNIDADFRGGCAVRMGGTVECWGGDTNGALGNGPGGTTTTPTQVLVLGDTALTMATQVSVGAGGGCARRTDGTVYCWGDVRGDGVGGSGSQYAVQTISVAGAQDVSCGNASCCAAAGGNAWCWGSSGAGQLGNNDFSPVFYNPPTQVLTSGGGPALGGVIDLEAGRNFNCARTNTQQVVCWGEGSNGQLGRGENVDRGNAGAPTFVMGL
ncbi:MAG: hypothetical protein JJ863_08000 [Deltaproteobacteria bacterium]|nr:hypothetical protein [Deltaproteobacteria bacterium]